MDKGWGKHVPLPDQDFSCPPTENDPARGAGEKEAETTQQWLQQLRAAWVAHLFLPSFPSALSDPSQCGAVGVCGAQGRESPGEGRWGCRAPSCLLWDKGGRRGKEEPLLEHEVDFSAGVGFWRGCGCSGFEFTQPNPLVMISLCSLFLKKKRVCVTSKPKCLW